MPPSEYADDAATEIDHQPHWSSRRASTVRVEPAVIVEPQAFPVVQIARTVTRVSVEAPAAFATPVAFDMRRAPVRPVFTQRRAMPSPPPPPRHVAPRAALPQPFYSYAEDCARQHLVTERVAPLPASALRSTWGELLEAAWSKYAAPACGLIAGLIFVVGYLAYSSQRGAGIATAAAPVAPIVMPAEVAMAAPAPVAPVERAPTVATVNPPEPTHRAKAGRTASIEQQPARASVTRRPAASKRRAVRINDATPLGDLRPGRSR